MLKKIYFTDFHHVIAYNFDFYCNIYAQDAQLQDYRASQNRKTIAFAGW